MAVLILLRDDVPLVRFVVDEVATLGRASECEVAARGHRAIA